MSTTPYKHRCWAGLRLSILRRDGYLCQINAPGCTSVASEADHIQPWLSGGAWFDPANLRAACAHCNRSRPGRIRNDLETATASRDW